MRPFKTLKRYKKRLERRFTQQNGRTQLNFMCDNKLVLGLKALARHLEIPIYPLAEHILQLGMAEVLTSIEDEALMENLQRHLLQEHLFVKDLKTSSELISRRALRLQNAVRFLELIETRSSPEAQREIIEELMK